MNILFLAHRLPYPPNKGDKIRSYHQLSHLARGHDVWCAAFVDDQADLQHVGALKEMCRDVAAIRLGPRRALARGLAGLMTGGTLAEAFYRRAKMDHVLAAWSHRIRFDAVLAFSSSMAGYALSVPACRRVIDFCDLDSAKWAQYARGTLGPGRLLYALEARRLARKEIEWARRFDHTVVITQQEAQPLIDRAGRQRIIVAGNGVTLPAQDPAVPLPREPVVGFVGAMNYKPNDDAVAWFCRRIWPIIRAHQPDARFLIVGRSPARSVKKLAALPGIEVTGEVADVWPVISGFRVSVAPLRIARGLQNKVLEAMASARPAVLTSQAARGIAARDNEHYLVADAAEAFAARVVRLLQDDCLAGRLGRAARQFVAANHHWPTEMSKIEAALTAKTAPVEPAVPQENLPAEVVA